MEMCRAFLLEAKARVLLLLRLRGKLSLAVQIQEQTSSPWKGEDGEVRKCQGKALLLMLMLQCIASCIYASGSSQRKNFSYPLNAKASLV